MSVSTKNNLQLNCFNNVGSTNLKLLKYSRKLYFIDFYKHNFFFGEAKSGKNSTREISANLGMVEIEKSSALSSKSRPRVLMYFFNPNFKFGFIFDEKSYVTENASDLEIKEGRQITIFSNYTNFLPYQKNNFYIHFLLRNGGFCDEEVNVVKDPREMNLYFNRHEAIADPRGRYFLSKNLQEILGLYKKKELSISNNLFGVFSALEKEKGYFYKSNAFLMRAAFSPNRRRRYSLFSKLTPDNILMLKDAFSYANRKKKKKLIRILTELWGGFLKSKNFFYKKEIRLLL